MFFFTINKVSIIIKISENWCGDSNPIDVLTLVEHLSDFEDELDGGNPLRSSTPMSSPPWVDMDHDTPPCGHRQNVRPSRNFTNPYPVLKISQSVSSLKVSKVILEILSQISYHLSTV